MTASRLRTLFVPSTAPALRPSQHARSAHSVSSRTSSFLSPARVTSSPLPALAPLRDRRLNRNNSSDGQAHVQTRAMLDWIRNLAPGGASTKVAPPPGTKHVVLGNPLAPPEDGSGWPAPLQQATFGLGCFWGAERKFWQAPGVYTTSVGYTGGSTPNPNYRSVCSGRTGHAEVVNVVFDPKKISFEDLLNIFWEAHDPTTKNRQGNDIGTQYRSAVYYFNDEQKRQIEGTRDHFNSLLKKAGRNACTTEIAPAGEYFLAETYHQQYLHKNPGGYCGLGGTGLFRPRESKE